jgi:dsDNA-binding SOS-regulon protein
MVLAQEFYDKFLEYKELISKILEKGDTSNDSIQKYEDLRKWLIRKHSVISDGLLSYKFQMSSVPVSGQRVFGQDKIMSIQYFNDKLNALLKERDPLHIPKIIAYNEYSARYHSLDEENEITIKFLNGIEDTLLGYLGKLEEN